MLVNILVFENLAQIVSMDVIDDVDKLFDLVIARSTYEMRLVKLFQFMTVKNVILLILEISGLYSFGHSSYGEAFRC